MTSSIWLMSNSLIAAPSTARVAYEPEARNEQGHDQPDAQGENLSRIAVERGEHQREHKGDERGAEHPALACHRAADEPGGSIKRRCQGWAQRHERPVMA